nr:DUF3857 domain-containing protein [uncultured Brevundimonas sp.]
MKNRMIGVMAAWAVLAAAPAWTQEVSKAPVPAWVVQASPVTPSAQAEDAPIRILAVDDQVRFDDQGVHTYSLRRSQVMNRQGLPYVSAVNAVWSPSHETVEVHAIRIIRGDQVIDVLADQSFEVLRRENRLESAMLDGRLTATLQPRDIRVGDIVESVFTIHDTGGVLAPHREHLASLGGGLTIEDYRLRVTWPAGQTLNAAATAPWADVRPRRVGDDWVFEVKGRGLEPEQMPENAPGRFLIRRLSQFSDFADWRAPSVLMAPLYAKGATLEQNSPLLARIEAIKATHVSQIDQAAAALRLVQDEVRYLALSMGEGGYVPTPADEVWRSRYGDCKGKTVLLLALLHGLGVQAEAVMVSTTSGDGLPDRLPAIGWFDHVLVKATIDGRTYWMDGSSIGDRRLEDMTPPSYRWALPVRAQGAMLEPIEQPPAHVPTNELIAEADLSGGLDAEGGVVFSAVYRGAVALLMRERISAIPRDQLQTLMTSNNDDAQAIRVDTVDTRYDEDANIFYLTLKGTGRQSWVNGVGGGRIMALPEAKLSIPYEDERTGLLAAYKDTPYALVHPFLSRGVYRYKLPGNGEGFSLEGGDQTVEGGGYRMERRATLEDGLVEVVVTTTSLSSEISAADMAEARTRAKSFTSPMLRLRAPASYVATAGDRARLDAGDSDPADLVKRAERLAERGDDQGALALYDAAIEAEPDNIEALRGRGESRLATFDYAGARADFDRAVDLDPADIDAVVGQGQVARAEGRHADAVVSFSVALRLDPSDVTALSSRGASYYQIGRWDRSLADYRALKTALPTSDVGLLGELRALTRLGRTDEARTIIKTKLETVPGNYVALRQLTKLDKAQSLPALDAGLAASPDNLDLLALRAETRALSGDATGARADFAAMRAQAGDDTRMMNGVCWSQAVAGFDPEQTLADCDVAARAGEAAFIDSRALALLQLERFEDAKIAYDQALAVNPRLGASLYGRGLARLALGDAEGEEDLRRARTQNIDVAEDFAVFEARHPRPVN